MKQPLTTETTNAMQPTNNTTGIKLIIFDFDGTLGDSRKLITDTMLLTLRQMGLEERTREECARTIGLPLEKCFSTLMPMSNEQARQCAEVYGEIFHEKNVPGAVKPFPGVVETVRLLQRKGMEMAIASSRRHRSLQQFVMDMKLEDCFSCLIGADDVTRAKPDAEPVTTLLAHFGRSANETLVVGDTDYDILMGRNAGVRTCGVTYGNGTATELTEAGADFLIHSMSELLLHV